MKIVNNTFLTICMLLVTSCASTKWETRSGKPEVILPNTVTNKMIVDEMASAGWLLAAETSSSLAFEKNANSFATGFAGISSIGWNLSVIRNENETRLIMQSTYKKLNQVHTMGNSPLGSSSTHNPIQTLPPNKKAAVEFQTILAKLK